MTVRSTDQIWKTFWIWCLNLQALEELFCLSKYCFMYVNILVIVHRPSFLKQRLRYWVCIRPQVNKRRGSYSSGSVRKS